MSKRADKWLPHIELGRSRLVPAALQNEAGIVGAAMMAAELAAAQAEVPAQAPAKTPRKGAKK